MQTSDEEEDKPVFKNSNEYQEQMALWIYSSFSAGKARLAGCNCSSGDFNEAEEVPFFVPQERQEQAADECRLHNAAAKLRSGFSCAQSILDRRDAKSTAQLKSQAPAIEDSLAPITDNIVSGDEHKASEATLLASFVDGNCESLRGTSLSGHDPASSSFAAVQIQCDIDQVSQLKRVQPVSSTLDARFASKPTPINFGAMETSGQELGRIILKAHLTCKSVTGIDVLEAHVLELHVHQRGEDAARYFLEELNGFKPQMIRHYLQLLATWLHGEVQAAPDYVLAHQAHQVHGDLNDIVRA